ncbi:hypothetical protein AB1I68_00050 [Paenibacillus pabuli]|uniref:hypothetical protein n=1 Tax=Paenibacillus pabuli TaxID=1472 RepID=UPI00345A1F92
MKPITKLRVAEIISASQGVHYTGQDAVIYLIVVKLILRSSFDEKITLSRAEAFQWIRQLAIHGKLKIYGRPIVTTELSLLPDLIDQPSKVIPDFSTEPVTDDDLNFVHSWRFFRS